MKGLPLHEWDDFADLVRVVSVEHGVTPGMVEKDYWVVQCLKAIQALGWEVHFKGGTSLSKGFGILQRFSEDLDLKLEPDEDWRLPADHNWKSEGKKALRDRERFFDGLVRALVVPGCRVREEVRDPRCRSIGLRVEYPVATDGPPPPLTPGVLLEIGHARVTPAVVRPIVSWVAEYVRRDESGLAGCDLDPAQVPCVLPAVTLLEKLDAICRRYPSGRDAAAFVRHYEDAAAIVKYLTDSGTTSPEEVRLLYAEMREAGDIRSFGADSEGLALANPTRNAELEKAWRAAEGLHWGRRLRLDDCAEVVREYLRSAGIGV